MKIAHLTFLVRDYDEAIAWFTGKLGFALVEDTDLGRGKRWVLVGPPFEGRAPTSRAKASDGRAIASGGEGVRLLLARASTPAQQAMIGRQGGGRVFLFLETGDFARDHAAFVSHGVRFLEPPRHEAYGIVAVFEDLYGNRWDLIEPVAAGLT